MLGTKVLAPSALFFSVARQCSRFHHDPESLYFLNCITYFRPQVPYCQDYHPTPDSSVMGQGCPTLRGPSETSPWLHVAAPALSHHRRRFLKLTTRGAAMLLMPM